MISVMSTFNPGDYGSIFASLVNTDRRRRLDAGRPDSDVRSALKKLSVESAFAHTRVTDADMAACCISGVWLLHDYLDDSHKISQDIDTTSSSFWHGIMHRREGDFWNSKYWFRRVGQHPAFEVIADRAKHVAASRRDAIASLGETRPHADAAWDPFTFVDLCEAAVKGRTELRDYCLDVQQAEWEVLFDHCYHAAVG
jgi:hypothetical protein